jgi:hypothetical protein
VTTVRPCRIVRCAVLALAGVVLPRGWYVGAWLGLWWLAGRGWIGRATTDGVNQTVFLPVQMWRHADLPPGRMTIHRWQNWAAKQGHRALELEQENERKRRARQSSRHDGDGRREGQHVDRRPVPLRRAVPGFQADRHLRYRQAQQRSDGSLHLASRMELPAATADWSGKPQISTDGWHAHPGAVIDAFGSKANYGQIVKAYNNAEQPGRYGPPTMVDSDRRRVIGIENLMPICASHVERNNLTIRTFMKRFTRLSLGFSKKLDNLAAAVAVHVAYFNYCWRSRENQGGRQRLTPAMQAGITNELWTMDRLYDEVMGIQ